MQTLYHNGYTITQKNLDVSVSKRVGQNNEHTRATSFQAITNEQANRWFILLAGNMDFAKHLIF